MGGPDGNLWITDYVTDHIIRMTPTGAVTAFVLDFPLEVFPENIITGPDGNLWFSTYGGRPVDSSSMFRMTTSGEILSFDMIRDNSVMGMTTGSDGNVWFTSPDFIGRLELPLPYSMYLPLVGR